MRKADDVTIKAIKDLQMLFIRGSFPIVIKIAKKVNSAFAFCLCLPYILKGKTPLGGQRVR